MTRSAREGLVWIGCAAVTLLLAAPAAGGVLGSDAARLEEFFEEIRQREPDVLVGNGAGGMEPAIRCGTPSGDPQWRAAIEEGLGLWREMFPGAQERARTFDVAFHIVHKKNGVGNIPDEMVMEQIDVLNDAYDAADFHFNLASLDRKVKKKWFKKCHREGPFIKMTNALAIDPAHRINIYTCGPGGGLLGFAILPGFIPEESPQNAVVLHFETLPGGAFFPYDEGDTGTHECGHYLGLLHTFQNGCTPPGDEVSDTKYEAIPAFGCPVGRDTCPQSGTDPVRNYMDYSDDACMNKFTSGQRKRMNDMLDLFRPSLSP
jgi:hypothetical protein